MKELIESIENQIKFNSNVVISKDDANKLLQALTSVKSVEEVPLLQKALNEYINLRHTQEECIGFIDGYVQAMHDFANNSEAMRQHAIGFVQYIDDIEMFNLRTISDEDRYTEYMIYLTNKEK
jgi:hypothetical protein